MLFRLLDIWGRYTLVSTVTRRYYNLFSSFSFWNVFVELAKKSNFINRGEVRAKRASIVSCLSELFRSCHGVAMVLPCGLRQWAFATLEIDTGYPTSKDSWVEMVLKVAGSQHVKENMIYKCNFWSWFGQHQPSGGRRRNFLVSPSRALYPRIGMTAISSYRNFKMAVNQIKYESRLLICER